MCVFARCGARISPLENGAVHNGVRAAECEESDLLCAHFLPSSLMDPGSKEIVSIM
jgi:hypothetical protein